MVRCDQHEFHPQRSVKSFLKSVSAGCLSSEETIEVSSHSFTLRPHHYDTPFIVTGGNSIGGTMSSWSALLVTPFTSCVGNVKEEQLVQGIEPLTSLSPLQSCFEGSVSRWSLVLNPCAGVPGADSARKGNYQKQGEPQLVMLQKQQGGFTPSPLKIRGNHQVKGVDMSTVMVIPV